MPTCESIALEEEQTEVLDEVAAAHNAWDGMLSAKSLFYLLFVNEPTRSDVRKSS